ncbi:hypothetical protein PQR62_20235 [Herbaspirillum lusitanum]|uniref:Uncharacterized protein n=1 Tax=Herbaspirillum lusitanum TaxID=213312 RepID=A0ABW9AFF1_9BURK
MRSGVYEGQNGEFRYLLAYSETAEGWIIDGVHLLRNGALLFPKMALPGVCADEKTVVARGVGWCDVVVQRILVDDENPPVDYSKVVRR